MAVPRVSRPWHWIWIPAAAVVAFLVFLSLDRLTAPRDASSPPVFVVNKVVKVFVPPPVVAAIPKRRSAVPLPLPAMAPPPMLVPAGMVLGRITAQGRGIERSLDGGVSWQPVAPPERLAGTNLSIVIAQANDVTIEDSTGRHWSTNDGGLNWQ